MAILCKLMTQDFPIDRNFLFAAAQGNPSPLDSAFE
jgi:hypothetical protein